jgi:hypothetical protein
MLRRYVRNLNFRRNHDASIKPSAITFTNAFPLGTQRYRPPFASTAEPDLIRTEIGKMADRTAARTKPPAAC